MSDVSTAESLSLEEVEADAKAEPEEIEAKPKGFWARLIVRLRTRNKKAGHLSGSDSDTDLAILREGSLATSMLSVNELDMNSAELQKVLEAAAGARIRIQHEMDSFRQVSQEENAVKDRLKVAQDALEEWRSEIATTYIAKVQKIMDENLSKAKADLELHKNNVQSWSLLDEGMLLRLRKAFHLGLAKTWRRAFFWLALLFILLNLSAIKALAFLALLYNPVWSGPLLVGIGIIIYSAVTFGKKFFEASEISDQGQKEEEKADKQSSESDDEKKTKRHRRAGLRLGIWLFIWLASIGVLTRFSTWFTTFIVPILLLHSLEIISAILTLGLVATLALLARYYSGWSTFRRQVNTQIAQLQAVIEGYVKTQQEIGRLENLYPQAVEWIQIIANAVYRPWKTDPAWSSKTEISKDSDSFPHALRIAQAQETGDPSLIQLENEIARRLLVKGWRQQAFVDLLEEIAAQMGSNPAIVSVETLDRDLPHQSNNSRALVSRYLNFSAGIQAPAPAKTKRRTGEDINQQSITDDYLVSAARKRLFGLIETTQSQLLSNIHPRVEQLVVDPLQELQLSESKLEIADNSQTWQDFLAGSLGIDAIETVALGSLTFNVAGRMAGVSENPMTYVLAPKRLEKKLPRIENPELVTTVLLGDDKPRAVEMVVRLDVSKPVQLDQLRVFAESQTATESTENESAEPKLVFPQREL